ncbi:hypothetical protein BT96DRAFT_988075 [Gymnopus androsaceus JB14]|uniref:DUF6593 domain-containing protein n=1 Tax=Gymnopus androsaceus JB14 TaxID=1447944 RepID=A0A6A4I7A4_9AGAR|nr:hypothetical protein BT96DRAFT_988075 [Gymnopus androsaceus JB14]
MSLKLYQRHPRSLEPILENTYLDVGGQTIYRVHTPFAPTPNRTTTISKTLYGSPIGIDHPPLSPSTIRRVLPKDDNAANLASGSQRESVDDSGLEIEPNASGEASNTAGHEATNPLATRKSRPTLDREGTNFTYLAQIDWRVFKSSKIRFGEGQYSYAGREVHVKDLFKKQGWGWWGRHRVFTGEDGNEYRWRLGRTRPELTLNDALKTPIATFHNQRLFSRQGCAYLEIFPQGQHMVDEIFVTFIYIERIRRVKQTHGI